MNELKITVLMPVFNAERYITEAILSVLEQQFADFELLIVNDGSTDGTTMLINKFTDPRIRLCNLPRQGISSALNAGLIQAKGSYIARFDADDVCLPQRLAKQLTFLETNPAYMLVGCDAEYITETGEHLFDFQNTAHTHEEIMQQLYKACPFIHSGVMYRKDAIIKAGGYCQDAQTFEDYLLWIRLAEYGKYFNLPERLLKVRFNPASVTMDEKWRGARFRLLKKNIIFRGSVLKEEAEELLAIIGKQNTPGITKGSYYALCGKKFLVNNYQPAKARTHFAKAIFYYPRRLDNYGLYVLSFLPSPFISWLYRQKKKNFKVA